MTSAQKSQPVSDNGREKETVKLGGLEFMATRMNVVMKKRELRTTNAVTPSEYFLLEEIEIGTSGARNDDKQIYKEADFYLKDLAQILQIGMNKLYVQLKSLKKKNLIVRKPTRFKGLETLGLNEEVFGQILIDKIEKRNHLSCVVNNSPRRVDKSEDSSPDQDHTSTESEVSSSSLRTELVPNRDQTMSELLEMIKKKTLLESSRVNKSVLEGKSEESFTPLGPLIVNEEEHKRRTLQRYQERSR